jgi:hypothetical protein
MQRDLAACEEAVAIEMQDAVRVHGPPTNLNPRAPPTRNKVGKSCSQGPYLSVGLWFNREWTRTDANGQTHPFDWSAELRFGAFTAPANKGIIPD